MIAAQKYYDRVLQGKRVEKKIISLLQKHFDITIEPATEEQDRDAKVDGWVAAESGSQSLQVKHRENGKDLIIDFYEPFGEHSVAGRDIAYPADWYGILIESDLHLIDGKAVKAATEQALLEWLFADFPLLFPFPGCKGHAQFKTSAGILMLKFDRYSERPKLLLHINPYSIDFPSRRTVHLEKES